jgi:autotransporter-associated beta strand protein
LENGGILDLGNTTQTQSIVNIDTGIMGNGLLNAQSFNFLGGTNSVSASLGNYDTTGSVANVTINSGITTLSGSSTYSGTTAVHGGLLIAGSSQAVGNSELMLHGGNLKIQIPNLIVPTLNWISTNSQIQLSLGTNTISATNFNIGTTNSNGAYVFNVINSALDNDYHSIIYYDSGNVPASANSFSIHGLADGDYSFRIINVSASGFNYALQAIISKTANYVVNGVDTINTHVTFNSITYDPNSTLIMGPSGQLNVTSNYTSSDTGTLEIIVTAAGATAPIRVGGTATLGGKLVLDFINGTAFGNAYNIISAENFQGTFENTNIFVLNSGFRARWIDSSTARYVVIAPSSYTQVAQNSNELQVATALDSFITATSGDAQVVSTALDFLTSEQYPVAFEQIMPTLYQSLSTISFNIANAQNQEMIQRLWGVRIAAAQEEGGNFQMSGFSERMPMFQDKENKEVKKDILSPAPDNHWGMFVDGNGIFAQASANNLSTYNAESGGVTTGFNYRWNKKVSTGLYAGYQGVYSKYSGGSTLVDDQVNFGLFGTYGQEIGKGLFIDALAGGAYDNYQMNRNISFGSGSFALNRTAKGMPGAGELNTMIASGYDFQKGNFTFGPLSSLQYQYFGATPFAESGAQALNLNVSSWDTSSLILSLGSHVAYNWQPTKNLLVIPQISLNWQHQFLENPYTINSTLNSGSSPIFANTSSVPLRDTLFTGIGFTIEFAKHWDTSFFYNASAGNRDLVSQNIFWSLGFNF